MAATSGSCRVVIVGGGFAGLFATRALRRAPVQVTLIDRAGHHLFQPLLYQCATGILSERKIAASDARTWQRRVGRAMRAVDPRLLQHTRAARGCREPGHGRQKNLVNSAG
jgi:2-polyprenyl-6-methoxyphenol hydroxylase-like FAD-dependent oxidoreductase